MRDRSYARYLAPIALVVVLVAGVVVVASSSGGSSSSGSTTSTAPKTRTKSGKAKKFYRVKPGDLITSISAKTGVDVATIIKLNHNLDPQSLQAGQLLRIRK